MKVCPRHRENQIKRQSHRQQMKSAGSSANPRRNHPPSLHCPSLNSANKIPLFLPTQHETHADTTSAIKQVALHIDYAGQLFVLRSGRLFLFKQPLVYQLLQGAVIFQVCKSFIDLVECLGITFTHCIGYTFAKHFA